MAFTLNDRIFRYHNHQLCVGDTGRIWLHTWKDGEIIEVDKLVLQVRSS